MPGRNCGQRTDGTECCPFLRGRKRFRPKGTAPPPARGNTAAQSFGNDAIKIPVIRKAVDRTAAQGVKNPVSAEKKESGDADFTPVKNGLIQHADAGGLTAGQNPGVVCHNHQQGYSPEQIHVFIPGHGGGRARCQSFHFIPRSFHAKRLTIFLSVPLKGRSLRTRSMSW